MPKIASHVPDELKNALAEYCKQTKANASLVIKIALEEFVINSANDTIPKLSAEVELLRHVRKYDFYKKVMRMIKSAGYGSLNLGQTYQDIDSMAISEEQKKFLRESAETYNNWKSTISKESSELIRVALPEFVKEKSRIEKLWETSFCKGCNYARKDADECEDICKKLRIMKGAKKVIE
jgi:hypothetical protein